MAHRSIQLRRLAQAFLGCVLAAALAVVGGAAPAAAATLPPGFQETTVFGGLTQPTAVRFANDGRVFVAEKSGLIKVFDSMSDTSASVYADLRTNVHDFWDRGMLGFALHPEFPTVDRVYVLYTYDAPPGRTAPVFNDACADATGDGCVVTGQLSWLDSSGTEHPMIRDWCQQYPSHSVGSLAFGADGALYVTGGDGASFNWADYGQDGNPVNPCGDPPGGIGGAMTPPTAEGGALRSQDVRTPADPTTLDGAVLRLDPMTGAALADNPMAASTDANRARIVAYGLRNPFRMTIRPGTSEVWLGDVGWGTWEEINRVVDPRDAVVENFGWPCYEGANAQGSYDGLNLNLCESLYAANTHTAPYYAYRHGSTVIPNEQCPVTRGSSVAGTSFRFYSGGSYPAEYDGALFFADYSRSCIWVMHPSTTGGVLPNPSNVKSFVGGAAAPVDIQTGPGGDLFYVDLAGGTIRRVTYTASANRQPVASFTADKTSGAAPLTVNFDGSGSSDPDGDPLTYAWDLDGDGSFGDGATAKVSRTYTADGTYTATLRVTDGRGGSQTAARTITVGNTPPVPAITSPAAGTQWKVGDSIRFTGSATDTQDGTLAPSSLSWQVNLHHCVGAGATDCHVHPQQTFTGAGGSYTGPDHEHPAYLELVLTATDSGGLSGTTKLRLDPRTVTITMASSPGGMTLGLNSETLPTSFTRTVIQGSTNTVQAPLTQQRGGKTLFFKSWSDGGQPVHTVRPQANTTYSASYKQR